MTVWKNELSNIQQLSDDGWTLDAIGDEYGVSRQRIYQVFTKFGLSTPIKTRKNFLKDQSPAVYWLNTKLTNKKVNKEDRLYLLKNLELPEKCPILDYVLKYEGTGGYRDETCPSLDRIDSSKGYEIGNLQVISWRANRIKNDATPEELQKIANYMNKIK
jgi:hypothetical protein